MISAAAATDVTLVGESNPLGADPLRALHPLPPGRAGDRLRLIFGLTVAEYLRAFPSATRRVNLLALRPGCRWDARAAEVAARALTPRARVLLGARVCAAHGVPYRPFCVALVYHGTGVTFGRPPRCCADAGCRPRLAVLVLPHPSGRCRTWNDPASARRARRALRAFLRVVLIEAGGGDPVTGVERAAGA